MAKIELFGTDGIRGAVDSPKLSAATALKLGQILAFLSKSKTKNSSTRIAIALDTRSSGEYLAAALTAGISSMGVDAHIIGVGPLSFLSSFVSENNFSFGIFITASHNKHTDNGYKIIAQDGRKIDNKTKDEIQYIFDSNQTFIQNFTHGKISNDASKLKDYSTNKIKEFFNIGLLQNKKIVIDAANGAYSYILKDIVGNCDNIRIINDNPNGQNINLNCGSEHPQALKKTVIDGGFDLGAAFDGDGDRLLLIDEKGNTISGDAVIGYIAINLHKNKELDNNCIAITKMSNLALDNLLAQHGISVIRTDVGDHNVYHTMQEQHLAFGGENSGHILFRNGWQNSDAFLTLLTIMKYMQQENRPISEVFNFFKPFVQILNNIAIPRKIDLSALPLTQKAIEDIELTLQNNGRIFLRYSGTEDVMRVLIECQNENLAKAIAQNISEIYYKELMSYCNKSLPNDNNTSYENEIRY